MARPVLSGKYCAMSNSLLLRLLQAPAIILLLLWMLIPLGMTLYFSLIRYVLNNLRRPEWTTPSISNWRGFGNYEYVMYKSKDFWFAVQNGVFIVGCILALINHGDRIIFQDMKAIDWFKILLTFNIWINLFLNQFLLIQRHKPVLRRLH